MRVLLFTLLLWSTGAVFAQKALPNHYLEAGIQLGFINYSGDVAEHVVELRETRLASGIFARYHLSNTLALKVDLFTGNISGSDKNAVTQELKDRSLRFKSNLLQYTLCAEWNVLNIHSTEENGITQFKIIPYIYAGVGGVMIHPKVEYYGPPEDFNKRILYSIPEKGGVETSLVVPFGGGLRTRLNDRVSAGIEGGWRYVFSDYLDGVSLNGSPVHRDWYFATTGTLSFVF